MKLVEGVCVHLWVCAYTCMHMLSFSTLFTKLSWKEVRIWVGFPGQSLFLGACFQDRSVAHEFVIKFLQKRLVFSDTFYLPVYSVGAANDPLSPLLQNLTPDQPCATNSIGLFRDRITFFFPKGAGSSVVNTEEQRLAVAVVSTVKWVYYYLVIHIMTGKWLLNFDCRSLLNFVCSC